MDFQGGKCKKMENSRGFTVNLTGNPGGDFQGNRYSQQGGYNFFLENPNLVDIVCVISKPFSNASFFIYFQFDAITLDITPFFIHPLFLE